MRGVTGIKRLVSISLLMLILLAGLTLAEGFAHSQLKNPPMNPQYGKMWMTLDAGEWAVLEMNDDRIAITEFAFVSDENLSSPGVMLYKLVTIPTDIPEAPGRAYQYFKLDYNNMVYWDVSESTFIFEVPMEWLDSKQNSASMVSLFKLEDNMWEEVPTRIEDANNETVTYYAESDGTKYALIAVRGAESNFEDFQTVNSGTLFLQQIGSNEIFVVREDEEGNVTAEPLEKDETADLDDDESRLDYETTPAEFDDGYFKEGAEETPVEEEKEDKRDFMWLFWLVILLVAAFLVFRWKMRPTIEKEVLAKLKKKK